jgi:hypothetical protein
VGASFGGFRTTLLFGAAAVLEEQLAVSAALEWRASERWTLQVAAGGILGGRLDAVASGPGAVGSVAASFLALEQGPWWPFLQLSASVAGSGFAATGGPVVALDVRAGLVVGYTFLERLTPYLVGRAFGGPVFRAGEVGTDASHLQAGLGLVVGLPGGFDLSVEFVPFGEQRLSGGLGWSF